MKPYQEIDAAVAEARNEIQKIASAFNEKTGGVIMSINIAFIDVTSCGSETKETIIGKVDIQTTH